MKKMTPIADVPSPKDQRALFKVIVDMAESIIATLKNIREDPNAAALNMGFNVYIQIAPQT